MSVGVLDLTYGRTLKPELTPTVIPISTSAFLNGISVSGNNFSFGTVGNYQCQLSVDADFGPDNSSRIVVDVFNLTTGVSLDSFNIDGSSGDTSWPLCFAVVDITHQFQIRAVTFSVATGTIKAVRIIATNLDPAAGGSSAPTTAPFVIATADPTLTQARVLTAGTNISITDNGPGGTIVINGSAGGVATATLPLVITASNIALGTAQGPTTPDATSSVTWSPIGAASTGLVLQSVAAQSVPIMEVQTSTGAVCFSLPVPIGTLTGANNNLIGINAGDGLTSGARNFLAGTNAGGAAASGAMSDVVAIGNSAGLVNTGNENTFIGSSAGAANVSGTGQTFVGYQAGLATTGNNNTFIGHQAGDAVTTGTANTIVGATAGSTAASAGMSDVTFFGYAAGFSNLATGSTFIGSSAGASNTGNIGNTYVGFSAGNLATGANNSIFGHQAGDSFTTGARNCLFGKDAGGAAGATSMSDTVMIGYQAGLLNTGNNNVFIGSGAGDGVTSGIDNVLIGKDAGGSAVNGVMSSLVIIGYQAGLLNQTNNNVFIGWNAGAANTSGTGQTFVGFNAGSSVTGNSNSIFGINSGDGITTGARNSLFGDGAGGATASNNMSDTTMLGYRAGLLNTASENTFIGSNTGDANITGTGQAFFGYNSGTAVTGNDNSIFGHQAGDGFTTGARNCLFGKDAGGAAGATSMSDTAFFGYQAGLLNTAIENTFLGSQAGDANTSGTGHVYVGFRAGGGTTNTNNTVVGWTAGNGLNSASNNTIIGYNAAGSLTTGSGNIILGSNTDVPAIGTSNSFIAGSPTAAITNVYFGEGVQDTSAVAYTINGSGGSGSDNAGAALQLAGGKGTGTAEPGLVVLKYPLKTTTGTTLQSLSTQSFPVSTTMFTGVSDVTVTGAASSPTDTTLIGSIVGTTSIEAGLLRAGRSIRIKASGLYTSSAVPSNFTIKVKFGSVVVAGSTLITSFANVTALAWSCDFTITCRAIGASGTTQGSGTAGFIFASSSHYNASSDQAATVDTTAANAIDFMVNYASNTAGNSITLSTITCEILN